MGIYIKGMQMPKNCHSCPMCLMRFCQAGDRELSEQETRPNAKRPEDCPLVPVPEPHGRLIDASEEIQVQMYDDQHEDFYQVKMTIDDLLSQSWIDAKAPTVIPAEEEP